MFLSNKQLEALTGYRRPAEQKAALEAMGIPFRVRPDGRPVVLESSVDIAVSRKGPRLDRINVT